MSSPQSKSTVSSSKAAKPWSFLLAAIVTVAGLGYFPKGAGTVASLAAAIAMWYGYPWLNLELFQLIMVLSLLVSIVIVTYYQQLGGSHDSSEIVIDEVCSQLLLLSFIKYQILGYCLAVLLFRLFDIIKIGPANWVDRRRDSGMLGGATVMIDDLIAAGYALIICYLMGYTTIN